MAATATDWRPHFEGAGATWTWSGDPQDNHVGALKSSRHTKKYSNSDQIVRNPKLLRAVAREWADSLLKRGMAPDWVVGHAPYATAPAYALTEEFQDRGFPTEYAFSARDEEGGYSTMFLIGEGDTVVALADDVVTGDSTRKTIRDLVRKGAVILGAVPCLANLSSQPDLNVELADRPDLDSLEFIAGSYL
jgi:orotate phosphoribosyltransferase